MTTDFPTLELQIDFDGDCDPWVYRIALNNRTVKRVMIDGIVYEPDINRNEFEDSGYIVMQKDGNDE